MSKAQEILQLNEMADGRSTWIHMVRDRFLRGAFGEYTKLTISRKVKIKDYWSDEITEILKQVDEFMDKETTKAKFKDRMKALVEAMREARQDRSQITQARNEMIRDFPEKREAILKLKFDTKELFNEMISEFLPQYTIK